MFARVEGIDYSPQSVEGIRAEVIKCRDEAITQAAFDVAVALSWTIAFLAEYADMLSDPNIVELIEGRRRRDRAAGRTVG
jgi:hypothetical protein